MQPSRPVDSRRASSSRDDTARQTRRWGDDRAILDDDEARARLLDAAARCIVRRGDTAIRMAEVSDEAGVSRSTLYRYFPGRDDLLLGLILGRIDHALANLVAGLRHPGSPERCLPEMVLVPVFSVDQTPVDPVNQALFAGGSSALATVLELGSEPIAEVLLRHYGPLLERWRRAGRLHDDIDDRSLVEWLHTTTLFLLGPSWRHRTPADKRRFVDRFLVRALVP